MKIHIKFFNFAGDCTLSKQLEDTTGWKTKAAQLINEIPEADQKDLYGAILEVDGKRSGEIKTERARRMEGGAA